MGFIISFYIVVSILWFPFSWVMPQLWPTGPENLIHPGYWMFVLTFFVIRITFNLLFRVRTPRKEK